MTVMMMILIFIVHYNRPRLDRRFVALGLVSSEQVAKTQGSIMK